MNHDPICICGHHKNRHKDCDYWKDQRMHGDWGVGECQLCRCEWFECETCKINPPPPRKEKKVIKTYPEGCHVVGEGWIYDK